MHERERKYNRLKQGEYLTRLKKKGFLNKGKLWTLKSSTARDMILNGRNN